MNGTLNLLLSTRIFHQTGERASAAGSPSIVSGEPV